MSKMGKKAKKYIVLTLIAAFCVSAFSIAAFAQNTGTTTGEAKTGVGTTTGGTGTQTGGTGAKTGGTGTQTGGTGTQTGGTGTQTGGTGAKTGGTGTQTGSNTTVTHEPKNSDVTVVFNLNGGRGMQSSGKFTKGTTVSEFKTPSKKGYKFMGWTMNGTEVDGSMPISHDTTLTAKWSPVAEAPTKSAASVNTNESAVNQAANEAGDAVSDPDALASQDWGSLLSSEESEASSASSQASSAAPAAGGFSSLFAIGIALIVLGLAGVGVFVYLQFIHKGKGGGKGGPRKNAKDDTMTFTDVSSYSDGRRHDNALGGLGDARRTPGHGSSDDATKPLPPRPKPGPRLSEGDATKPLPPRPKPGPKPSDGQNRYSEKAQAKPVDGAKSDFDWEKFFNEEK